METTKKIALQIKDYVSDKMFEHYVVDDVGCSEEEIDALATMNLEDMINFSLSKGKSEKEIVDFFALEKQISETDCVFEKEILRTKERLARLKEKGYNSENNAIFKIHKEMLDSLEREKSKKRS